MLTAARTTAAACVVLVAATLARAWSESEHDPWLESCDDCGQVCPTPFGPLIVAWFDRHECEAAS